ncbi:MAG: rhodanese-like domain-containing protein [Pseudomonadota bacterium]
MFKQRAVLAALVTVLLAGCGSGSADAPATIRDVNVAEAMALSDTATILDVRTAAEFAEGHIDGALNIDVDDASFDANIAKLDRSRSYVVHCTANVPNGRSARALETMQQLGFTSLGNMTGGYLAYLEATAPEAGTPSLQDE